MSNNHFQKLRANKINWLHASKPLSKEEREALVRKFGFYAHHVAGTQQGKTPRPKIAANKKYIYIVLHVPYQPANSNKFYICDLNIFITKDTLVTIETQGDLPALKRYFESTQQSKRVLERRLKHGSVNLFMNIIKYLLNEVEEILDQQGEQVDTLNKKIFDLHNTAEFIEKISVLRYNQIVAFSVLERQSRMMEFNSGEKSPFQSANGSSDYKWSDIAETFQTLAYELKADIDHLEGLVQTFETLVTHRTNETIKLLTIFSVVLLPLTLVSGIFGMNFLHIPFASHPFGFYISLLGMLTILSVMLFFFRWRNWI